MSNLPDAIIPPTPTLQRNKDRYAAGIAQVCGLLDTTAAALVTHSNWMWGLPTEELLELLNELGVIRVTNLFSKHTLIGTEINGTLDAMDPLRGQDIANAVYKNVAPVVPGRTDIIFNQTTMLFELSVPEEEE